MWVSKKEMDKIWKHIEQLEHTVNQLEAVHTIVDDASFPFAPSFRCVSHMPWATTKTAGAISFQELTETLVDGKPLMRKKTTEEEVKFKCPMIPQEGTKKMKNPHEDHGTYFQEDIEE